MRLKNKLLYCLFVLIILIYLLFYSVSFWNYHLPFYGQGFDSYQYMGLYKISEDKIFNSFIYSENLFPGLYSDDFHFGINIFLFIILKNILGINNLQTIFIVGLFGSLLFLVAIYFFLKKVMDKDTNKIILTIIIYLIFSVGSLKWLGRFNSFFDLLVISSYPSNIGISLMLILLGLNINIVKLNFKLVTLNILIFFLLFSSHILTGFIYLLLFFILFFTNSIKVKKINRNYIFIFLIYIMILSILLLWPYYNWLDFFINSNPIQTESLRELPLTIQESLSILGILMISLGSLIKKPKDNLFMIIWILVFFIVTLSYLTPFRVSSYWRFLSFIKIPLMISTTLLLFYLDNKKLRVFMICIIIITSFLAISFNINELKLKENNFDKVLNINNQLKSNSRIFGDPFISYGLQGLGDQQTFFVAEGHTGNIKSQKINKERLKIWDSGCNNLTKEFYIQFDYFITYKNTNCKSNFLKVFGSINYTDYKGIEIYEISKI